MLLKHLEKVLKHYLISHLVTRRLLPLAKNMELTYVINIFKECFTCFLI